MVLELIAVGGILYGGAGVIYYAKDTARALDSIKRGEEPEETDGLLKCIGKNCYNVLAKGESIKFS